MLQLTDGTAEAGREFVFDVVSAMSSPVVSDGAQLL